MNNTYTVKSGDTLVSIAQQHGASVPEIQALNPIIDDPDYIRTGWQLRLPDTPSRPVLPPPFYADSLSAPSIEGRPECHEELVDVAHITGEPHFYVLTARQSKALKQEINVVRQLMDELHESLAKALPITQCNTLQNPDASCACAACVKEAWTVKAEGAGLLLRDPTPRPGKVGPLTTDTDLQGQLATLQQARDWFQRYEPSVLRATRFESNWKALQENKIRSLDREINTLREQLAAQKKAEPAGSSTYANSAAPDLKHGQGRSTEKQRGRHTKTGIDVVEIILFSDPGRRHYIPVAYRNTATWHVRIPTRVMAGKPFNKQLAADLIKDIKGAIAKDRKAGPLGSLELKVATWNSQEDNLLNALHREVAWTSHQSDASPYAVSAEAHALRFAASASAGVNNWNPKEGSIDVGVKGSAAFSLGEGSMSLKRFFPDQGGYVANMAYRNALGQEVLHPMGVFRLSGQLELSCFVGTRLQGEAGVKTHYKPAETAAGATALLGTPTLEVGPSGSIGVKCNAFAGAQTGGALSGAFEWIAPEQQGTGQVILGQGNASSNWVKLAEIKVEGNAAVGVGANGEFGISISNNRLALNCKGSVVLGPGAGGGFATVVELDQVGKLMQLFCNALADMDYRQLLGVTEDAFRYMASGLYQVATSPAKKVTEGFELGQEQMRLWWNKRKATRIEAEALADYLHLHEKDKIMRVKDQAIPLSMLPPETLGPMVYLLTEGVIATRIGTFIEKQERALVILLSEVRRWRQFIEVLEHCSLDASKVNAMESLERINALLDGHEQDQFNRFIDSLAINQRSVSPVTVAAWRPSNAWRKENVLMAAQNSDRFDGLA